jgi:hypothetical protein
VRQMFLALVYEVGLLAAIPSRLDATLNTEPTARWVPFRPRVLHVAPQH